MAMTIDNLVRCMEEGGLEIAFDIKDVLFCMIKQTQNVLRFSSALVKIYFYLDKNLVFFFLV